MISSPHVRQVAQSGDETLFLLRLPLEGQDGFEEFLSSWVLASPQEVTLIDCGVGGSYGFLQKFLQDWQLVPTSLLLTHIHLDHCGGAGYLLRDFPDVTVFCFEKAAKHLMAPQRLWEATAETLGTSMARAYQPPLPIPGERIIPREALPSCWKVVDTPGHAPHHVSFFRDFAGHRICFGGEACGVVSGTELVSWYADGRPHSYLRPATPPRYIPETGRHSMELIRDESWDLYCGAHFGALPDRTIPERALKQNLFWEKRISQCLTEELSEPQIIDVMLREDPELAAFSSFSDGCKKRERYFCGNSVRGFSRFLSEQAAL